MLEIFKTLQCASIRENRLIFGVVYRNYDQTRSKIMTTLKGGFITYIGGIEIPGVIIILHGEKMVATCVM